MASLVRIREKGQLTLPLDVRKQLGLRQGDLLEASVRDGRVVLTLVVKHQEALVPTPIYNLDGLIGIVSLGGDSVADSARYDE